MANVALYYPHINFPETPWATRALLFWDRVGAIVPEGVELSTSTRALLDEGLLHRVPWWDVVTPAHELDDVLVKYVEAQARRVTPDQALRIDRRSWSRIHTMKMPGGFLDALRDTGMGEEIDWCWWRVRPDIATDFMTSLAYGVARISAEQTDLLTNMGNPVKPQDRMPGAYEPAVADLDRDMRVELGLVLATLFPVPRKPLSPQALGRFKRTYGSMLPLFRANVFRELGQLSLIVDPKSRIEGLRESLSAWKEESFAIQQQLESSGVSIVRRAIVPSVVGLTTYALAPDLAEMAAIVPAVCAIGQAALETWGGRADRRALVQSRPMAYAATFSHEMSRTGAGVSWWGSRHS